MFKFTLLLILVTVCYAFQYKSSILGCNYNEKFYKISSNLTTDEGSFTCAILNNKPDWVMQSKVKSGDNCCEEVCALGYCHKCCDERHSCVHMCNAFKPICMCV